MVWLSFKIKSTLLIYHGPTRFCSHPPISLITYVLQLSHIRLFGESFFLLSALHTHSQDIQICFIPGLPVATSLLIIHKWYDLWIKWCVWEKLSMIFLKKILDALLKCYHIAISILQSSLAIFVLFPLRLSLPGIKFLQHGDSLAYTYMCSTLRGPGTE